MDWAASITPLSTSRREASTSLATKGAAAMIRGGIEAMVSMVALGCGVALLPEVVLENSPEPVRNRVMILERSDEKTPFELGVCAQKKRLHEPLIEAFWKILPNH